MARMDIEDSYPHRQMILIGQLVNMVNINNQSSCSRPNHKTLSHNYPLSSSYSLPCATSSPSWRPTTGWKTTFSWICIFSEGFIHHSPRGAKEELFVGQRGEQTEVFLFPGWQSGSKLDVCNPCKTLHISAEHLCDGCELWEEEVEQRTCLLYTSPSPRD